jgi:hypothetical protein
MQSGTHLSGKKNSAAGMHMRTLSRCLLALALGALLAGCTAPKDLSGATASHAADAAQGALPRTDPGAPAGGGRVLNAAPQVLSFTGSLDTADNGGGSAELFTAVVGDANAEADLASLSLDASGPEHLGASHTLTAADLQRTADPGIGPDGWAVWDAVPHDGQLQVQVQAKYPYGATPGAYRWQLTVRDHAGAAGVSASDATTVQPVHVVEVAGAVTEQGQPAPVEGWGGWSAAPGASGVRSVTYLKVVNQGTAADQRFIVDFTSRDFVGQDDASWRVPLDGNLRFAAWEASPDQAPGQGDFHFGDVSKDGSVTLSFTHAGAVMYIAYEVVQVPTPLPSQTYAASATVTAL